MSTGQFTYDIPTEMKGLFAARVNRHTKSILKSPRAPVGSPDKSAGFQQAVRGSGCIADVRPHQITIRRRKGRRAGQYAAAQQQKRTCANYRISSLGCPAPGNKSNAEPPFQVDPYPFLSENVLCYRFYQGRIWEKVGHCLYILKKSRVERSPTRSPSKYSSKFPDTFVEAKCSMRPDSKGMRKEQRF